MHLTSVRRWRSRSIGLLAAGALATTILAAPPASAADYGPVEESNNADFVIDGSGPADDYPSQIGVSGLDGVVDSVRVTLDISHARTQDLDVLLQSPSGERLVLMSDVGGSGSVFNGGGIDAELTIRGSAPAMPQAGFGSGAYRPTNGPGADTWAPGGPANGGTATNYNQAFKGIEPNGTWKLFVFDDDGSDAVIGTICLPFFGCFPNFVPSVGLVQGWSLRLTTAKSPQNVTIADAPDVVDVDTADYQATATGNTASGIPIVFSADATTTNGACTVSPSGLVNFQHAGECVVNATQAGNDDYLEGSDTETITVEQASQVIAITSSPGPQPTVGTTYQVVATGGNSGNPIVYSVHPDTTNNACTVTPTGLVKFKRPGTCVIAANQAGNADYEAAIQVTQVIANVKRSQAIDDSPLPSAGIVGLSFQLNASGGRSSSPVTYQSSTPLTCSITPTGRITYLDSGTCTIVMDQAGDARFHPAATETEDIMVFRFGSPSPF